MKIYTKPEIRVIELQSKENMAAQAVNPLNATTYTSGNVVTTVYNLALMSASSGKQ